MKKSGKTGAKKAIATVGLCLALGLTIGELTGATILIVQRENRYKKAAEEFVDHTYVESDGTLYLDEDNNDYLLPEYNKYTTITRGKYIAQEAEEKDVSYCQFLGEYYTEDGKPIAFIDSSDKDGKAVRCRMIKIEDEKEPIALKENEHLRLINTKPYSELRELQLKVYMYFENKVEFENQEMYKGDLVLKK